ncbi:hypothetical protein YC2023_058264 [Brassica napus]
MVNEPLSLTTTTSFIVVCGQKTVKDLSSLSNITYLVEKKVHTSIYGINVVEKIFFHHLSYTSWIGYPGAVSNTPTYILMSETTMKLNMEASAENKNTPINLAQNMYWNLAGNNSWNILDHMIQIWGPHITLDPHTDHARSLRERDLLSLSPQEMDRRVYRRGGYQIRS